MKRASVYLILRPTHRFDGSVIDIAVDRMVRGKPAKLQQTEVAVQLHLDIDERLFQQFLPEVTVEITGARQIIIPEVEVPEQPEPVDQLVVDQDALMEAMDAARLLDRTGR